MADVVRFPREREARYRIDRVEPPATPDGRLPPHDLEAQAAVLSACIVDRAALDRVLEMLKPEHFFGEAHARIWQAIQQLAIAKVPVDFVSVGAWLREREWLGKVGGSAYLAQIADAAPVVGRAEDLAHTEAHAATVLECFERRDAIAKMQRRAAELYGDVGSWTDYKADWRAEVGRLTVPRAKLAGRPIGAVVDQARARVAAIHDGARGGVEWGFYKLERFGLLGRKRLTILAGRPGMGKTALGFQVCVAAALRGEAVYVASWEMPGDLLLLRAACAAAYVSFLKVEAGKADADELEKIAEKMTLLKRLPMIIDDERCTTSELAARVRVHKDLFASGKARRDADGTGDLHPPLDMPLVMVDYIQRGIDGAQNPRNDKKAIVGATSKGLDEHVAKGCDVATLVLAMLRRVEAGPDGKVREPMLDDLKESGEIEEDASTVVLIHRPQYYLRKKCPAELRGVAKIIPAKGRYGEPDDAPCLGFSMGHFTDQLPPAARGEAHYEDAGNDNGG